ncbi:hypothetical protein A9977_15125 [Variovorax sp. UMC13]|nr:hypothetical protein [Variovorax sp. UMC13]
MSADLNWRARLNGSLYEVEAVATSPMRSLAPASAKTSAIGSNRFRMFGCEVSLMARLSARKASASTPA